MQLFSKANPVFALKSTSFFETKEAKSLATLEYLELFIDRLLTILWNSLDTMYRLKQSSDSSITAQFTF